LDFGSSVLGSLYRFKALEPDVDLLEAIKEHKLKIEWDIEWEGKGISAELQREEIGSRASEIALLREVRDEVNNVLRFVAEGGNYVIEGREKLYSYLMEFPWRRAAVCSTAFCLCRRMLLWKIGTW